MGPLAIALAKADVSDPVSGFFMARRDVWDSAAPKLATEGFKVLFDIIASHPGPLRIAELPYRFRDRLEGESKLDRRVVIDYALTRSNGHSHARGKLTQDYQDFLAHLDPRGLNYAAPVPGFPGVTNAHMNEYSLVREASGSPKFAPLNLWIYLKLLEGDIRQVEDPAMQKTLRQWLEKGREKLAPSFSGCPSARVSSTRS